MNIENKRQIATVVLAVALGLVAAFLASQHVKNSIEAQTKRLAKEYEKQIESQKSALMHEMERREQEFNKKMMEFVKAQQQIQQKQQQSTTNTVSKPEIKKEVFSVNTPAGKRALTVMIDSLSAVGGLINPGDMVDIIASINMPDPRDPKVKPQQVISVLFQDVQILAVDTSFKAGADDASYKAQQKARSLNVTLALDPEEAGLLTFVQANGKLQLSLRSPSERGTHNLQVASWDALSDYVLERQGTELTVPRSRADIGIVDDKKDEVQPFIQIFRGGREGG
ncbi:MAG TPA: Flp pilus assembly protein CpaB [Candidatus Omnitrophica bacterium]|nr:MAG: Flp pilus assembly protein CpaB [Omnitrophica WOR_2 bacterium GWA2_45_18]OGX18810.1 MAG: Flp pilus assembly protein CpaB [Omnitrophica WOR_2 bacterium GWC2_45_7]HBR15919.1 Flp pilus assembly protein CpaB [Candidatus Omnitrophota bacterium]